MPSFTTLSLFLTISSFILFTSAQDSAQANGAPIASIKAGVVAGTTTALPSASAPVNKFLGVPFATATRFGLPVDPTPWTTPVDTKVFKPGCLQAFPNPPNIAKFNQDAYVQPPEPSDEDCLYANVYAPSNPSRDPRGYAILLYIFGGDYNFGNGGQPLYDGSAFAAYQDVIVVTFNYRNSAFGFPNSPAIPIQQQNLGIYDQRYMFQWVQDNIAAFGGDPGKVTIWGESSGAQSVDGHLVAYNNSNAPFRAAILEAGQSTYTSGKEGVSKEAGSWKELSDALKCAGDDAAILECVKQANATDIINACNLLQIGFAPVPDQVTYYTRPAQRRVDGNFARIPVMGGTNRDDGEVFVFSGFGNITNITQIGQIVALELQGFGVDATNPQGPALVQSITGNLTALTETGKNAFEIAALSYTLIYVQCLYSLWGLNSANYGAETFRYFYDAGGFPNENIYPNAGSYHSAEIRQVWMTYAGGPVNPITPAPQGLQPSNLQPTPRQEELSRNMNAAWARFAKNPYLGPGWPAYLPGMPDQILGHIGADGGTGITFIKASEADEQCSSVIPLYRAILGADYPGLGSGPR